MGIKKTYWIMVILCLLVFISIIIHFVIFFMIRQEETFKMQVPEVMGRYWSRMLNQLGDAVIYVLINLGVFARAKSTAKEILDGTEKDTELLDNIYWISVLVGGLGIFSMIKTFVRFTGVFSLLVSEGYAGEAMGMLATIVVPLVLIAGWTIWLVKELRMCLDFKKSETNKT